MLRLNDDCLSNIFDRLELRDQLALTAVCERFRDIIVNVQWRSLLRRFEYNSEMDALAPEQYHAFLALIVDRIEHVVISCSWWDKYYNWIHTQGTVRPDPIPFYRRFVFPVLRVLEIRIDRDDVDMQELSAHCPFIEELHMSSMEFVLKFVDIVDMRHLRILHAPASDIICENDLQEILWALPLTELYINEVDGRSSVAEVVFTASDLQILEMLFYWFNTPHIIKDLIDLATTSERRNPLTVYIKYKENCCVVNKIAFQDYKLCLQTMIEEQVTNPKVTILFSEDCIEFRLCCQSNNK